MFQVQLLSWLLPCPRHCWCCQLAQPAFEVSILCSCTLYWVGFFLRDWPGKQDNFLETYKPSIDQHSQHSVLMVVGYSFCHLCLQWWIHAHMDHLTGNLLGRYGKMNYLLLQKKSGTICWSSLRDLNRPSSIRILWWYLVPVSVL